MFELCPEIVRVSWLDVASKLATPIIAMAVVYIAYQQYVVSQATLREKLFERRFSVFKDTQYFLSEILREAKFSDESYSKLVDAGQRARFLFGKPMREYLEGIRAHASKMQMYQRQLVALPVGDERSENARLQAGELTWLTNQLNVIFDKFEPYLGFEKHK